MEDSYNKYSIDDIDEIVRTDTLSISPESDIAVNCIHTALNINNRSSWRDVDFNGGVATRYYEDREYARAYALSPYSNGIAIIAHKKSNDFTILVLGEDDGSWFVSNDTVDWITDKSTFISLVSEALSIFNANYVSK